jgi:hypothetical protein
MADQQGKVEAAPEEPQPQESAMPHTAAPKPRQSLAKSRRELTEEELSQSGVRMMLLDELDRLDAEVSRLSDYREKFYASDKRVAQLEAHHKRSLAFEIVHVVSLSLGVGALMLAPTIADKSLMYWALAIGFTLVICGIVAKAVQAGADK